MNSQRVYFNGYGVVPRGAGARTLGPAGAGAASPGVPGALRALGRPSGGPGGEPRLLSAPAPSAPERGRRGPEPHAPRLYGQ